MELLMSHFAERLGRRLDQDRGESRNQLHILLEVSMLCSLRRDGNNLFAIRPCLVVSSILGLVVPSLFFFFIGFLWNTANPKQLDRLLRRQLRGAARLGARITQERVPNV